MGKRLTVMESFVAIRDTTNPYQTQLVRALADDVDVRLFSWRAAVLGRFDVLHIHWPEVLIRDRTRARTAARQVLFLLVLLHIRLGRKALVRTLHNVAPHEPGAPLEGWLLRLCDRFTTYWIALNEFSPVPAGAQSVVIPHGHYRDWFAQYPVPRSEPGRLLYFGRIRRYKGLEELLGAFREQTDSTLRLRIVGSPDEPRIAEIIRRAAQADTRIGATLRHVSDSEAAAEFGRADVVVLPYPEMHNSGALLLGLSLGRRVLVPDNEITRALAHEVGPDWVLTYSGPFDWSTLRAVLETVRATDPAGAPDLSLREWGQSGRAHAAAFALAAATARRRRWWSSRSC